MRAVDKYENESPDSDRFNFGAALALEGVTAEESNCYVSIVNDWEFCDITIDLALSYSATETPATIRCVLASSDEAGSTIVNEFDPIQ